jgi:hypothetical protein
MGKDHGGFDIFMAKQFLDGANVVAGFQEMGGKGMAKSMKGDVFFDARQPGGVFDSLLQAAFVEVVTTYHVRAGVF